ncbi:MAG: hypothetical protein R3B91_21645 [Planctomycetaceae bacterium]
MQTKDTNGTRSFYDRISKVYDVIADGGEHTARERGLAALAVQSWGTGSRGRLWHGTFAGQSRESGRRNRKRERDRHLTGNA